MIACRLNGENPCINIYNKLEDKIKLRVSILCILGSVPSISSLDIRSLPIVGVSSTSTLLSIKNQLPLLETSSITHEIISLILHRYNDK